MRKENRQGVELEIYELGDGVERCAITNWPGESFVFYADPETKKLSREFVPRIEKSIVGRALVAREPGRIGELREALGERNPRGDYEMEQAVHPVVGMAAKFGEFGGFDEKNYPKAVECMNWYLARDGLKFRAAYDPEQVARAIENGYLRTSDIEGTTVYFPTRDSVRAMCDTPFERIDYALGLHIGVQFCTTANRRLPDWAGD